MGYLAKKRTAYWQDKKTGQIIKTRQPESYTPCREWFIYFREVRLLHNAASGQVCAEAIDGRQYSGVGGQLDFVRAAALSVGGRSFLCLHSTHEAPDGTLTSNIRAHLPSGAVVTTPRSDVMYIVTEWGAADLHNQPLETRICAMIRIAHPRFRCALAQEAVAWGQLSPECAAQFDTQPEPEKEETT